MNSAGSCEGLPYDKRPVVKLVGTDGNAFSIMGKVSAALRKAGFPSSVINKYVEEATSGDYNHLLYVTLKYVKEECEEEHDDDYYDAFDEDEDEGL